MGAVRVRRGAVSVAEIRHQIADDLAVRSVERDSIDDVLLVVSELVGNAVTHAADEGAVDVDWQLAACDSDRRSSVLLRVCDGSPAQPTRLDVDPATAASGRGLAIVAAIAQEWGVDPMERGKQVWARVPVQQAAG